MDKKRLIELIISIILIICGVVILILPLMNFTNAKMILIVMMVIYGIVNLIKYFSIRLTKDKDGLYTAIASIIVLSLMYFIDVEETSFKLTFILFVWIILMSLIKLFKSDYYHDRKDREWIIEVTSLLLFIVVGILTSINLYNVETQVLVLGFFYLIHGILELLDPLTQYLIAKKN